MTPNDHHGLEMEKAQNQQSNTLALHNMTNPLPTPMPPTANTVAAPRTGVASGSGSWQDTHEPEYEPLSLIRRATAFAMDAALVWATTAALYRLSGDILPSDPEQASWCFHIARLLLSVAYHAVMLRWLAGTMGHVAMKGAVVIVTTENRPGTARCVLRALLGALDTLIVPLLVNAVMTVVRRDRRHLYDLCAGTRVVLYREPQREPSS